MGYIYRNTTTAGDGFRLMFILQQVRDGLQEATLVGQGPRPKTVKLAGA